MRGNACTYVVELLMYTVIPCTTHKISLINNQNCTSYSDSVYASL